MSEFFSPELVGAIIGGIISGFAGIVIVFYTFKKRNYEELKIGVYEPLYNSITNIGLEPFLEDKIEDKWERLENHKKLNVDKDIKELYEKYAKLGNEHSKLKIAWAHEYSDRKDDFLVQIEKIFAKYNMYNEGRFNVTAFWDASISTFVDCNNNILFDHEIQDSEDLFQKLYLYSKDRKKEYDEWLEKTHKNTPQFFEDLFTTLQEINKTFPKKMDYSQMVRKRDELKPIIIKIRKELKKKLQK